MSSLGALSSGACAAGVAALLSVTGSEPIDSAEATLAAVASSCLTASALLTGNWRLVGGRSSAGISCSSRKYSSVTSAFVFSCPGSCAATAFVKLFI